MCLSKSSLRLIKIPVVLLHPRTSPAQPHMRATKHRKIDALFDKYRTNLLSSTLCLRGSRETLHGLGQVDSILRDTGQLHHNAMIQRPLRRGYALRSLHQHRPVLTLLKTCRVDACHTDQLQANQRTLDQFWRLPLQSSRPLSTSTFLISNFSETIPEA